MAEAAGTGNLAHFDALPPALPALTWSVAPVCELLPAATGGAVPAACAAAANACSVAERDGLAVHAPMGVISAVVVEATALVVIHFELMARVHHCQAAERETQQHLSAAGVLIESASHAIAFIALIDRNTAGRLKRRQEVGPGSVHHLQLAELCPSLEI